MAYNEFTLQSAREAFGLEWRDGSLYDDVEPQAVRADFEDTVNRGRLLAAQLNNEVAKVSLIIAPILLEVKKLLGDKISLFVGVEFNVDRTRGLNGVCDFLVSNGGTQFFVTAPVLAVAEAKNESLDAGLGQCIAEMVAAQMFNEAKGSPETVIHGVVSTGALWRFLRLTGKVLEVDRTEYFVVELGKIMAVLLHILGRL